jgi:ABC-type transport system involved in multi-copper enzyme maturation permease subunit
MPKILLSIGVLIVLSAFSFITLGAFLAGSSPRCTPANNGQTQNCTALSSAERADLTAAITTPLRLPASLIVTVSIIGFIGSVLIVVLTGTVVGGEYGVGTIRVLLTRGPTRTQYLLAKILAILACIAIAMLILVPLGLIVGALYNLFTGTAVDFGFFTGDWLLHAIAYVLLAMLNLFIYALIALWLATLGKSTAAGIAGAIVWLFLEFVFTHLIVPLIANFFPDTIKGYINAIPDYFVGNNISALLTEQTDYLTASLRNASTSASDTASTSGAIPDWRAWIVIAIYLAVFLGITWWVSLERDITN